MAIKLLFETALYVSFEEPDTLVIEFADPDIFISENGIQMLPEDRKIERKLMKQLPQDAKAAQESINAQGDNAQTATTIIMISQFALGVGLKKILDMINALQIIILLPLIEV